MSDNNVYVILNMDRRPSAKGHNKGVVEEYITTNGRPRGYSKDMAEKQAAALGYDVDAAVILAPDDCVVHLDDSARKLPRGDAGLGGQLDVHTEGIRMV